MLLTLLWAKKEREGTIAMLVQYLSPTLMATNRAADQDLVAFHLVPSEMPSSPAPALALGRYEIMEKPCLTEYCVPYPIRNSVSHSSMEDHHSPYPSRL